MRVRPATVRTSGYTPAAFVCALAPVGEWAHSRLLGCGCARTSGGVGTPAPLGVCARQCLPGVLARSCLWGYVCARASGVWVRSRLWGMDALVPLGVWAHSCLWGCGRTRASGGMGALALLGVWVHLCLWGCGGAHASVVGMRARAKACFVHCIRLYLLYLLYFYSIFTQFLLNF